MRALLLAAGLGTRLRPLTDTTPKCLMPVRGKPLLDIWLEDLSRAGVGPFLVNTHYLAEHVRRYVAESRFADQVQLVHEPELLGTAGTLNRNLDFFADGEGLLIHADNYCEADLAAFLRAHETRPAGCVMTMMTFATSNPSACGIVELDPRGVVIGFHEKKPDPPGNLANGAVYILSAELIELMRTRFAAATDFSTEVIPQLVGRIHTYETRETFVDIGSVAAYEALQKELGNRAGRNAR